MDNICAKCGGTMESGVATASGLLGMAPKDEPRLQFAIPGTPTSMNPITAFKQGVSGEQDVRVFWIEGRRCSTCGLLELFARNQAPS